MHRTSGMLLFVNSYTKSCTRVGSAVFDSMQVVVGVDLEQRTLLYLDSLHDGKPCARAKSMLLRLAQWSARASPSDVKVRRPHCLCGTLRHRRHSQDFRAVHVQSRCICSAVQVHVPLHTLQIPFKLRQCVQAYTIVANRDPGLENVEHEGVAFTETVMISALQQDNNVDCGVHCARQLVRLAAHAMRSQGPVLWQDCGEVARGPQTHVDWWRQRVLDACFAGKLELHVDSISTGAS